MAFNAGAVAKHISIWLDSYSEKSGLGSFVVGVSGGIDSAVTASLCVLTGRQTFLVKMPIHQSESEVFFFEGIIHNSRCSPFIRKKY